ncbi:MAG: nickel pincer cofactor biosynthesis protein LarB [Verrucomicrobia bacterium]|jgi:pyridinium-3,5-biscarboxylic acid mononucleotide synthase|nr:nickel pincer cofactor biosynthesis protein LarB [Verrucomicrobiota bacterium]MBT7068142.1 nickel pincer cofactor biosynthesis protein LarB [Verrucomicrobiota bacterium]MBT7699060.1 nickel pincer cofactor biosynthesis protein LarB [Verrucomicrobiota bacterium]
MSELLNMLSRLQAGELTVAEAAAALGEREVDLGFARVDTDRQKRRGLPEVIFSPGKQPAQMVAIAQALIDAGQNVFATRIRPEQHEVLRAAFPDLVYHDDANAITIDRSACPEPEGCVAVVCAGTSDRPVAAEAALAAERMGAHVEQISDVGVAGLHRLMNHVDRLRASRVIVVVAGMEGALPSVVAGLVNRPVIAVPTSVGYGASLKGIAALLTMLNSCVPGITVVNIDNGFGAGVAAGMINKRDDEA